MYKVCIYCTQHLQTFLFGIKFYDEGGRIHLFDQSTECNPYSWTLKPPKKTSIAYMVKKNICVYVQEHDMQLKYEFFYCV